MIIEHFLHWIDNAKVADRAAAADALARTYLDVDLAFEDRCTAEAALTMLLDDASPIVRAALADALSLSPHAPAQIIAALAGDKPEIAGLVIARSPVLSDMDLVDRVATAPGPVQSVIAARPRVSVALAAAIAEVGDPDAVVALLENTGAEIASVTYSRIVDRLGDNAGVRGALLDRPNLPVSVRHRVVAKVGAALGAASLVVSLMGARRAERLTADACSSAAVTLVETTPAEEHAALAEHLRVAGDLTVAFVLRIVAHGKLDFFAAVLVALTRQKAARVGALLANGSDSALAALFGAAQLPPTVHAPLLAALKTWRAVAAGRLVAGIQEVTWSMLRAIPGVDRPETLDTAAREIASLVKAVHLEFLRRNARGHALIVAAA